MVRAARKPAQLPGQRLPRLAKVMSVQARSWWGRCRVGGNGVHPPGRWWWGHAQRGRCGLALARQVLWWLRHANLPARGSACPATNLPARVRSLSGHRHGVWGNLWGAGNLPVTAFHGSCPPCHRLRERVTSYRDDKRHWLPRIRNIASFNIFNNTPATAL